MQFITILKIGDWILGAEKLIKDKWISHKKQNFFL